MNNPCKYCEKASIQRANGTWEYGCKYPCEKLLREKQKLVTFSKSVG